MYAPLHRWKTSLCEPDCESCAMAHYFPCHIYAMANKPHYTIAFFTYALTILSIHRLWYELYYMNAHQCPTRVEHCLGTDCTGYMMTDGPSLCVWREDVCTYSTITCLEKTPFTEVSVILSLFYLCLFFMHYVVRRNVREQKQIQGECLESTIPCGLAQLYREIV
jgi:hypothetical protein